MDPALTDSGFSLLSWGITPWTVFGAFLLPMVILAWWKKIYPAVRFGRLAVIPFIMVLPLPWMPTWWWGLPAVAGIAILFIAAIDLVTVPRPNQLKAQRVMTRVASIRVPHHVAIEIDNLSHRAIQMDVADDSPHQLVTEPIFQSATILGRKRLRLEHTITSNRRGAFQLKHVYVFLYSRWRLWRRHVQLNCESELHVYPDIKQIAEYALLARTNRLSQIGVRRTRRAGQDNNFERLRDYLPDDNYKHIDWRSTARRQKMTVKQFQTDQSQRVIFLLDCGRMMTNEYNKLSLLDYALNSVLLLSYVALSQGDSVGMLCFSDRIHTYVPPAGGKRQMNRLLHAGFNQFPTLVQSRFDEAFLYLSTHCRRRSLVVLVSNVIDQVNATQIQSYMGNLTGCHLPLLALMRDHRVFDAADNPLNDPDVLYRSAAAAQLLVWRDQVLKRMKAAGALTVDAFPEELTSPMVNAYLEVKARHLL